MITRQRAHDYAADLRAMGDGIASVTVFRYQARANRYPEGDKRSYQAHGYAVRYTPPATGPTIVLFTDHESIPADQVAGIIADIPGEPVTPYWVAARRQAVEPATQLILKQFTAHDAGASYSWNLAPGTYYHVIMEESTS